MRQTLAGTQCRCPLIIPIVLKLCLHVTSAFASASNVMNGFHGTKWRCSHFAWNHAENGLEPILCLCVCVTIDPIQNFDANVNADAHANVTCKQSLKHVCNSFIMLESVIYDQFSIVDYRETRTVTNIHHSLSENMWGKFGGCSR